MASARAKLIFRLVLCTLFLLLLFYVGRPLYWKISATFHDIRANKQTVSGGISQIVHEAKRSVGWLHHYGSETRHGDQKLAAARRLLDVHQIPERMSILF
ncbi:OLC1v1021460C1 [Oldenlandia corymbosa var. corymbosa]|uniref:OLC1v1021460C1 n=1 Tax=Oldenlandia corymbosa var. corymbosa TaxID=529605 RepID=A0AAV1BY75_OLDCO|nr:OLC1v1021460C1 [Oldenlandia corymbosa var. corymbosa]